MKLKLYYLFIALMGVAFFSACSDDDNDVKPSNVPEAVASAFAAQYPQASAVEWEKKGNYFVAEFYRSANRQVEVEAWYKADGTWAMTEEDYGKDLFMIPTDINNAFNDSGYASWTIDDISYYSYPTDTKNFYRIEVEKAGNPDTYLYFNTAAELIKTTTGTDVDITPDTAL